MDEIKSFGEATRSLTPASMTSEKIAPATSEQILKHLAVLSLFCPQKDLTPEQASLKSRIFCDDLRKEGFSDRVIEAACRQYRLSIDPDDTWFPAPGKLIEICRRLAYLSQPRGEPIGPARPAVPGPLCCDIEPHPSAGHPRLSVVRSDAQVIDLSTRRDALAEVNAMGEAEASEHLARLRARHRQSDQEGGLA